MVFLDGLKMVFLSHYETIFKIIPTDTPQLTSKDYIYIYEVYFVSFKSNLYYTFNIAIFHDLLFNIQPKLNMFHAVFLGKY